MQLLTLTLDDSRLKGYLFENNLSIAQFNIPLEQFHPFFFQNMGLDLKKVILCTVAPHHATLHREKIFHNVPSTPIKKLLSFYQSTLFPFEEGQASYVSSAKKIKKTLFLKTTACVSEKVKNYESNFSHLGLYLDFMSCWQKALLASFLQIKSEVPQGTLFFQQDQMLYILDFDKTHINFSSALETTSSFETLKSALETLKKTLNREVIAYVINLEPHLEEKIKTFFKEVVSDVVLDRRANELLYIGAAIEAKKNTHNLCLSNASQKNNLTRILKSLSKINLLLAGIISFGALFSFITLNHNVKKQLDQQGISYESFFVSNGQLNQKIAAFSSLKSLETIVSQAPSMLDILAFFSAHPVLVEVEKQSGKNTSVMELDYKQVDLKTASVTLKCIFPDEKIKERFETDLKKRRLVYTAARQSHITEYKITFTKGFSF